MEHTAATYYAQYYATRDPGGLCNSATTPVTTPVTGSIPPDSSSSTVMDTLNPNILVPSAMQDRQVKVLTPCTSQHDRFIDPEGRPLQPGTVIFCDDLPFIVSANGKIYN